MRWICWLLMAGAMAWPTGGHGGELRQPAGQVVLTVAGSVGVTNRGPYDDFEDAFADKGSWPDGVEKFLFCDELAWTLDEIVEHCEHLRSELYCFGASPQVLVSQVQGKGVEYYAFFVPHCSHQRF